MKGEDGDANRKLMREENVVRQKKARKIRSASFASRRSETTSSTVSSHIYTLAVEKKKRREKKFNPMKE